MVYRLLRDRISPPEKPTIFITDKTTKPFVSQMMMIIHEYYYGKHNSHCGLNISRYSNKIMCEYCKSRADYHLPVTDEFDSDCLYQTLEKSKNMDFFDLLDCMIHYLSLPQNHHGESYIDYNYMVDEMNESMQLNGIGYKIKDGQLIIQTEQTIFDKIIEPCLNILQINDLYEADSSLKDAFDAFKCKNYEMSVIKAAVSLENILNSIIDKNGYELNKNDKMTNKFKIIISHIDLPKQFNEHIDSLVKLLNTPMSVRNDRAAHDSKSIITEELAEYTINTVCSDILLLVRSFYK